MKTFLESNTIRASLLVILGAWVAYLNGEFELKEAIVGSVAAIIAIFMRKGQGVPIKTKAALVLIACILVAGCATPDINPPAGTSGTSKGGDADSGASGLDFNPAVATAPGAVAVSSPVRNEDRTSNSQAGDSPQLVLGGQNREAFEFLMKEDPVEQVFLSQINVALKSRQELAADAPPEIVAAADARVDALRDALAAHMAMKLQKASAIAGGFEKLQQVVFLVVQVKANGVPPEHLAADAIEQAAKGIEMALKPAANATE